MLFNSFTFVTLVIITAFLYYQPALRRFQVVILIAASFIFYAYNQPILLLLLISSIAINVLSSYYVVHGNPARRVFYAATGVTANLLVLAFFKYSGLLGETFLSDESTLTDFLVAIPLPIGISFFTFQGITLIVDLLRIKAGNSEHHIEVRDLSRHAINTTFYISFFPQLVAGPIVKAHEFLPQIHHKNFRDLDWDYCFKALVVGYFLKMVIADNLKDYTFWITYPYFQAKSSYDLIAMLFGYSMQIFADFAGYSLIAIGIAGLFGYRLPQNFNFPYISGSISEFWKRWHISLSSFLKEYLYIPIGGNRRGSTRTYINLLTVMLLGGLWHGAAWSYMVWGGVHGTALAVERYFSKYIRLPENAFLNAIRIASVFCFVTMAWLLFKLPEFDHVLLYLRAIMANTHLPIDFNLQISISLYSLPVIFYHLQHIVRTRNPLRPPMYSYQYAKYGLLLFLVIVNSGLPAAFVYFQF